MHFAAYAMRGKARRLNADAFVTVDEQGRAAGLKMKAISSATDFSYYFQNLGFTRVAEAKHPRWQLAEYDALQS